MPRNEGKCLSDQKRQHSTGMKMPIEDDMGAIGCLEQTLRALKTPERDSAGTEVERATVAYLVHRFAQRRQHRYSEVPRCPEWTVWI